VPELELRRTAALCFLGIVLAGAGVAAQRRDAVPARAVDAVIRYRRSWMADTTRFDACSVAEWTSIEQGVQNPGRVLLGAAGEGCVRGRLSPAAQGARHLVVLDSAVASDSAAQVVVVVRRGEYTHRETFSLVYHRVPGTWAIREVRLWGSMQASPAARDPR
jgi:hypothetical protein